MRGEKTKYQQEPTEMKHSFTGSSEFRAIPEFILLQWSNSQTSLKANTSNIQLQIVLPPFQKYLDLCLSIHLCPNQYVYLNVVLMFI